MRKRRNYYHIRPRISGIWFCKRDKRWHDGHTCPDRIHSIGATHSSALTAKTKKQAWRIAGGLAALGGAEIFYFKPAKQGGVILLKEWRT